MLLVHIVLVCAALFQVVRAFKPHLYFLKLSIASEKLFQVVWRRITARIIFWGHVGISIAFYDSRTWTLTVYWEKWRNICLIFHFTTSVLVRVCTGAFYRHWLRSMIIRPIQLKDMKAAEMRLGGFSWLLCITFALHHICS